ncbi:alpha/beta fold hydrolase [Sulfolobus tengchongensis]|uniref:Alpha/beta fold hydrolase n=1 Tax=Sulfolobus tengchongensis TaxID=207809 RepID=A0AAX4KYR9_9CREN
MSCIPFSGFIYISETDWLFHIIYKPRLKGKSSLLIMFHGFTGNHIEAGRLYTDLAMHLCNEGISTLRFDYRGHGDSSGFFEDAFSPKNALDDAETIVNHALKMGYKEIAFLGFSLGGYIALKMFEKFNEAIKALVLFAPAILVSEPKWETHFDKYAYTPLTFGPFRIKSEVVKEMTHNVMGIAEKINVPTLIVHSKDDEAINYSISVEFFNRMKFEDKQLILLEKGGHTFNEYGIRQKLYKEVTEWLRKRLT